MEARTMTNGDLLPAQAVDSADYCVLALSTSREKSLGTPEGACIHGYLGHYICGTWTNPTAVLIIDARPFFDP